MQNSTCLLIEESLLNKYIVQPYWLIVASSICLTIMSVISDGKQIWTSRESILTSFLGTNKYVFGLHLFMNCIQFCILLVTVIISDDPSWIKYEQFYIRWTNSGALLTLATGLLSSILSEETKIPGRAWSDNACMLIILSFVPIFFTHVFLLGCLYIWLVTLIGWPWFLSMDYLSKSVFKKIPTNNTPNAMLLMDDDLESNRQKISISFLIQVLAFKLIIIGLFISWFQTLFNYGVLLFEEKERNNGLNCYFEIMSSEFSMRNTKKYFQAFQNDSIYAFFIVTSLF